jgi:hypothetical protein
MEDTLEAHNIPKQEWSNTFWGTWKGLEIYASDRHSRIVNESDTEELQA